MPDKKIFIDSNILIYALSQENSLSHKKQIAVDLLCQYPILSTQIINECSNVLRRKFNWDYQEIQETLEFTLKITTLSDVTLSSIQQAWLIGKKYHYSYFDSIILASALEMQCEIIYSEDMQQEQLIENTLKIINPFI